MNIQNSLMLINYIPVGKSNAITRQELVRLTGESDRAIRKEIKRLNRDGIPILSSSRGCGYWISDDLDELEQYINETDHRRESLYYATLELRKELYRRKGIRVTVVKEHIRRIG